MIATRTKLGPYEILAPIGAGGMGEVYRAKDTRLDRTVAIKVLPSHLSADPERKQRFEREARTISSLNHPHICTLHDIGHQDGIDYLVMEYVDGESLAQRIEKGSLTTELVLRYGIQIAEALDKAHRQGIVHRDLKPGNIMLTKSGAKLLDFGLARYQETKRPEATQSQMQTAGKALTEEGVVLGTVQYMSPEQLEGKEIDSRTDLFALGTVLYEMATGKKAFTGKSQASLISAILKDEPAPISQIQPMSPLALDRVVKTCLAKDPDDRWQSAHDLAGELKWISESGSQETGVQTPVAARQKVPERIYLGIAAILLVALCALAIVHRQLVSQPARVIRLSIVAPEGNMLDSSTLAVSPDGTKVVFAASTVSSAPTRLWVRDLDSLVSRPVAGTEGADFPFWSPDSRKIGFFADGKLQTIDLSENQPQVLCVTADSRGGTWSRNGMIIFASNTNSPLSKIPESGGTSAPATALDQSQQENSHRWPWFLPDGIHFLYFSSSPHGEVIYAASLESKERKQLLQTDSSVEYAGGYLFFVRDSRLMAQAFDTRKLELSGQLFTVAENVGRNGALRPFGYSPFSVSEHGVLVHGRVESPLTQFGWFDRNGKELGSVGPPGSYGEPAFSPDQQRVVIDLTNPRTGRTSLWQLDPSRGTLSRFTSSDVIEQLTACWSPDGREIAFSSYYGASLDLYQSAATGAGREELLLKSDVNKQCDDWTPDGRYIVFENYDPKNKRDLWALPTSGDKKPFPILNTEFNEAHARVSPDSHWIAYASDESGRDEVYVRPFPNTRGGKWQISSLGGDQPQWGPDGKELFYISLDDKLMASEVQSSASFEASIPTTLFQTRVANINLLGSRNNYLVSDDGRRFLVNSVVKKQESTPITVVINWTSLLKR